MSGSGNLLNASISLASSAIVLRSCSRSCSLGTEAGEAAGTAIPPAGDGAEAGEVGEGGADLSTFLNSSAYSCANEGLAAAGRLGAGDVPALREAGGLPPGCPAMAAEAAARRVGETLCKGDGEASRGGLPMLPLLPLLFLFVVLAGLPLRHAAAMTCSTTSKIALAVASKARPVLTVPLLGLPLLPVPRGCDPQPTAKATTPVGSLAGAAGLAPP